LTVATNLYDNPTCVTKKYDRTVKSEIDFLASNKLLKELVFHEKNYPVDSDHFLLESSLEMESLTASSRPVLQTCKTVLKESITE
jgi:hypothetical protein